MPNSVFYRYFCKKYQRDLTKEEMELHDCFHHKKPKKGKHGGFGKPCGSLIKIPVLQDKKNGGEKLD